jgi:thiosulfate dehydrogenase [quinone] large subunit
MTTTPHRRHLPAPVMEPDGDREPIRITSAAGRALAVRRIAFGLTFLRAFVDKVFGLGYATPSGKGWIDGATRPPGFLGKGSSGPIAGFHNSLVGDFWVSPLFMIGLAGLGIALTLGIGMQIAAASGALLYLLMWSGPTARDQPGARRPHSRRHLPGRGATCCRWQRLGLPPARHGTFKRLLIGSTSESVASQASVPVVVVPDGWKATEHSGPVLVALDDSGPSEFAAAAATERHVRLRMVHVLDLPTSTAGIRQESPA